MLFGSTKPPVFRLRPGTTTDSYGDPVESWDAPASVRLPRADVHGVVAEETDAADRRVLTDYRDLFIPYAADLTAADRIQYLGKVWTIEGAPVVTRGLLIGAQTTAKLRLIH